MRFLRVLCVLFASYVREPGLEICRLIVTGLFLDCVLRQCIVDARFFNNDVLFASRDAAEGAILRLNVFDPMKKP